MFNSDLTHQKMQKSQQWNYLMHIAFELGCSGICINRVMADFMQNSPIFVTTATIGRSRENLNGTIQSAVPENPCFVHIRRL